MMKKKKWKIAFQTRYELYEYLILSFELINASFSFQHYINEILHEYLNVFCIAYINDILIYSNIRKKHIQHVRKMLERLRAVKLQVNIKKCEFIIIEIKYLSLIITTRDIKMNSNKINAVLKWHVLKTIKDVQSFLNFANFYRRFIWKFSQLIKSLTFLIKKDHSFQWIAVC